MKYSQERKQAVLAKLAPSSVKNPTKYEQVLIRGAEILKQKKYPGF